VTSLRPIGLDSWGAQSFLLALLSVLGGVLGVWFLVTGIVTVAQTAAVLDNGEVATSEVVKIDMTLRDPVVSADDYVYATQVRFETAEGSRVTAWLPESGIQRDYRVGESVRIVYDATDPSSVVLDDDQTTLSQTISIIFGGALMVIAVALGIPAVRIFRKGRKSLRTAE
jgi:hypothetical protein